MRVRRTRIWTVSGLQTAAASSGRVGWCEPDHEQSAVPAVRVILGVNNPPRPAPLSLPLPSNPFMRCPPRSDSALPWGSDTGEGIRPQDGAPPCPPTLAQRLSRGGG